MAPTGNQMTAPQANMTARNIVMQNAIENTQQIFSQTFVPANQNVINIPPKNVGLIKGFWVEITATISNTGGTAMTPTDFGPANVLSQIVFTDLNNNVRIQTTGWHVALVNTAKAKRIFGSAAIALTGEDSPMAYGSNWNVISQTASVAAAASGTVVMRYWVPLAYSDTDYRGAVYGNVINATMNLQLTLNTTPIAPAGTDSTNAVYKGTATGAMTSATVSVYQVFMDQVPMVQGVPILPRLDLATVYELKNTLFNGMVPNQEFPAPYANMRDFLSTFAVYYNGASRAVGSDINYFSLQAANFSNLWKKNPYLLALGTRNVIGTDFPPGVYYFSSRQKPINSVQFGNIQLMLNPITAGATAYMAVGYEDFGLVNTLGAASSLPSNS